MTKVEGSLWSCKVAAPGSITGTCDTVCEQKDLEKHLSTEHALKVERPSDVVERFALIQGSGHGRAPRLGKVEDQTIEMFGKDAFR